MTQFLHVFVFYGCHCSRTDSCYLCQYIAENRSAHARYMHKVHTHHVREAKCRLQYERLLGTSEREVIHPLVRVRQIRVLLTRRVHKFRFDFRALRVC